MSDEYDDDILQLQLQVKQLLTYLENADYQHTETLLEQYLSNLEIFYQQALTLHKWHKENQQVIEIISQFQLIYQLVAQQKERLEAELKLFAKKSHVSQRYQANIG